MLYLSSNTGFNEDNAQYTVQKSGIYAIDFNILLSGISNQASQAVTGNILRNGVTTMSSMSTYGTHKTISISSVAYLQKDQVFSSSVSSVTNGYLNGATMEGGFSVYFLKSANDVTGKSSLLFYNLKEAHVSPFSLFRLRCLDRLSGHNIKTIKHYMVTIYGIVLIGLAVFIDYQDFFFVNYTNRFKIPDFRSTKPEQRSIHASKQLVGRRQQLQQQY